MKKRLIRKNKKLKPNLTKTIISLFLLVTMLISIVGCSKDEKIKDDKFNTNIITRDALSLELSIASESLALVIRHYIYTQLLAEDYLTLNIDNTSIDELLEKSDKLLLAFKDSEDLTNKSLKMIEEIEKSLITAGINTNQFIIHNQLNYDSIFTPIYAKAGREIDPQTWAENLSKQYDDLKGAEKFKQLAQQLNTDAKTAYSQMQLASKIIQDASAVEETQAVSDAWTKSTNILQVYKTTAKVSLLATSTVASGGGTLTALAASSVSLKGAGALIIAGTDCLIDIGTTSSNIILGEKNQVTMQLEDLKDKSTTFSFIAGLVSPSGSFAGETLAFVGESLVDLFYDNKIIGIKLNSSKDKKVTVNSQVIDVEDLEKNQAIAEIEKAGFNLPSEKTISLQELIDNYANEIEIIMGQMDKLVKELAKTLDSEPLVKSDESIFGTYTLYATSSVDDEVEESKVSLIDRGDNKVYWKLLDGEEETEDEQLILDYDPQNQTLKADIGTTEFYIEFNFDTEPISADGYFKGLLLGNEIFNEMTMVKD